MAQNKTTLILNNLAELTFPIKSSRHIQIQGKQKGINIQKLLTKARPSQSTSNFVYIF